MAVYGADAAIGVAFGDAKLQSVLLGHGLHLEREDAQVFHDGGHARGYHAEVFGTDEHAGSLHQTWEFLHSLSLPVLGIAMVEIVVVEAVEDVALVVVEQHLIDEGVLSRDARVVEGAVLVVAHKEDIAY